MPRPTNKEELLEVAEKSFEKLSAMTSENITFNPDISQAGKEAHWGRDKNIRDLLIHLYEWHKLLLNWVNENKNGNKINFLPEPYKWTTYGDMNVGFWEKHQTTTFEESVKLFTESHKLVIKLISELSNEELFEKKHYDWTGTTSIGAYCISATSAHYDWAMKKIKANAKLYKKS
jgi:hypothetical protein